MIHDSSLQAFKEKTGKKWKKSKGRGKLSHFLSRSNAFKVKVDIIFLFFAMIDISSMMCFAVVFPLLL